MCFLSVKCGCSHSIAVPADSCIRPRHPRGCWIIRRAQWEKVNFCFACQDYFSPSGIQPTWKEVLVWHRDPNFDGTEASHRNVIAADRIRHQGCENERLEFKRKLRWKLMVRHKMVRGWRLTDNGVVVAIVEEYEDDGYPDDIYEIDEGERMEILTGIDPDDYEAGMQDRSGPGFVLNEDPYEETSAENGGVGVIRIGHSLKRVDGGMLGRLRPTITIHPLDDNESDEEGSSAHFEVGSSSLGSTDSDEAELGSQDDLANEMQKLTIGYVPENESHTNGNGNTRSIEVVMADSENGSDVMPMLSSSFTPAPNKRPIIVTTPPPAAESDEPWATSRSIEPIGTESNTEAPTDETPTSPQPTSEPLPSMKYDDMGKAENKKPSKADPDQRDS